MKKCKYKINNKSEVKRIEIQARKNCEIIEKQLKYRKTINIS